MRSILALTGTNHRNSSGQYVKGHGKGKRLQTFHARISDNISLELQHQ